MHHVHTLKSTLAIALLARLALLGASTNLSINDCEAEVYVTSTFLNYKCDIPPLFGIRICLLIVAISSSVRPT